ncbi:MAG: LicD family protein [Kiritimatiellae bacterium]|nr:LicD family protein [Kiritimatiellia bacterium]
MASKAEIRQIQYSSLELLKKFDGLCAANSIRYFLCGGALLGAARQKGFIPWDDDIDVVMLRDDFRRLEEIATKNPPSGTFWIGQGSKTHAQPNVFWGKLCASDTNIVDAHNHGDMPHCFGLDVFPLDELPGSCLKRMKQRFGAYFLQHLSPLLFGGSSPNYALVKSILRLLLKPFFRDVKEIANRFLRVAALGNGDNTGKLVSLCGRYGHRHEQFKRQWFEEVEIMEFEGMMVPVAKGWLQMLEMAYGKDWRIPKRDYGRDLHYKLVNPST